jgi:hypothetical protein
MRVSHETIYLSLFVQSRGALRRELQRTGRAGWTGSRRFGVALLRRLCFSVSRL